MDVTPESQRPINPAVVTSVRPSARPSARPSVSGTVGERWHWAGNTCTCLLRHVCLSTRCCCGAEPEPRAVVQSSSRLRRRWLEKLRLQMQERHKLNGKKKQTVSSFYFFSHYPCLGTMQESCSAARGAESGIIPPAALTLTLNSLRFFPSRNGRQLPLFSNHVTQQLHCSAPSEAAVAAAEQLTSRFVRFVTFAGV